MPEHVIVIGGSVTGLGAALALSAGGYRVTILERDATPLPSSPLEAFQNWNRRGAPQTRHSHAFLARLHNAIRDRYPALYAELLEHGAEPMTFQDFAGRYFPESQFLPEDAEITLLACRRITFEWVLRRHVLDHAVAEFRDGVRVDGLDAAPDAETGLPRVRGVKLTDRNRGAEVLAADFVVDASGRRSRLPDWLAAIGAAPMREDSEPCGIFYSSRFYRLRDGVVPPAREAAIGADLGYMKYGIFPGDDRIFSVTLAASPEDAVLRSVLRPEAFELAASAFPAVADWISPEMSEPISDVHGMGDLRNTRRHFTEDGLPRALGLQPIGDALIHTNPITGRGCTLAWVQAQLLADALSSHPGDLLAAARAIDEGVRREIWPWFEAAINQDRDAMEVDSLQRTGVDPFCSQREDGSVDPRAYMRSLLRDGLVPGLREDLVLLRAFMRMFNLLESPSDLMKRPDLLQAVLAAYQRREEREAMELGPSRHQMLERLERIAA